VDNNFSVENWTDLYLGMLGAAAALTGLLFVSISVNLERVVKMGGVPERGLETLVLMLGVILLSMQVLQPQSQESFGRSVFLLATLQIIGVSFLQYRRIKLTEGRGRGHILVLNTVTNQLPGWLMLIGAVSIHEHTGSGMYWLNSALIAAIISYFSNAWILLVEIIR
jgi:modulator of FtsH protease